MKVLTQQFMVFDKVHAQGLLDWLDVYFMPVEGDLRNVAFGLTKNGKYLDLSYQMEFDDESAELVLEMISEMIGQFPSEFNGFVSIGEYRIIQGSTPFENFLLSQLQQSDIVNVACVRELTTLKAEMTEFKKLYKKLLDEIQSLKVYNHGLLSPKSLTQVLYEICQDIEREDILEVWTEINYH